MKTLRIDVTQEDIDAARQACVRKPNPNHVGGYELFDLRKSCPIAQALHRTGYAYASVDGSTVQISDRPDIAIWEPAPGRFDTTATMRAYMQRFDRRRTARPRTFVLRER